MNDFRVALAQMTCPIGELEANLSKHCAYAEQAAALQADAICFPECSLTGYPEFTDDSISSYAQELNGELVNSLALLSGRTGLLVLAGMVEAGDGCLYITQVVAGEGTILGRYRKVHMAAPEAACYAAGDELPVWQYRGTTFGIQICFDNHFGEAARILALHGASIIFCPYASPGPCTQEGYKAKQARWLRYQPARAFDNGIYLCVANQVGRSRRADNYAPNDTPATSPENTHCGMTEYPGGSMVINPWGEVIVRARSGGEDLVVADVSAATLEAKRRDEIQFFERYRRPELYAGLVRNDLRSGGC